MFSAILRPWRGSRFSNPSQEPRRSGNEAEQGLSFSWIVEPEMSTEAEATEIRLRMLMGDKTGALLVRTQYWIRASLFASSSNIIDPAAFI